MLAAMCVLAASLAPACGALCCADDTIPTIHAAMPCCETQPRIARSEAMRVPQATTVAVDAQVATPIAAISIPASRIAVVATPATSHHQPSPPLFLRNAQLLI